MRTKYEHSVRTGTIDDEVLRDMAGCPPAPAVCNDAAATAEHVGMRHFDIADRNRDRFTLLGSTTPIGTTSFTGSITYGKDNYPNSDFGLQNYKQNIYAVGFDMVPNDQASFGLTSQLRAVPRDCRIHARRIRRLIRASRTRTGTGRRVRSTRSTP